MYHADFRALRVKWGFEAAPSAEERHKALAQNAAWEANPDPQIVPLQHKPLHHLFGKYGKAVMAAAEKLEDEGTLSKFKGVKPFKPINTLEDLERYLGSGQMLIWLPGVGDKAVAEISAELVNIRSKR